MTIQGSINIALSSLNLLQQQSSMISTNMANASTAGYAQRDVIGGEFRSGGFGSGVVATEVRALANQTAAQAANQASSALAFSQRMVDVLQPYGQQLGQPTGSTSLTSRLSALDSALVTLSATPADASAQAKVVNAARALTETLHGLSEAVASARQQADKGIATAVDDVNGTLHALERNETARMAAASNGQPTASFDSTREKLLADLSENVPVSVQRNGDNSIVVTTDRGSTLWDGAVHELSFDATPVIPSTMAAKADAERGLSGGLSGVTVDGQPIAMSRQGSIAANLELRDTTLPGFGAQLDRIAGNRPVDRPDRRRRGNRHLHGRRHFVGPDRPRGPRRAGRADRPESLGRSGSGRPGLACPRRCPGEWARIGLLHRADHGVQRCPAIRGFRHRHRRSPPVGVADGRDDAGRRHADLGHEHLDRPERGPRAAGRGRADRPFQRDRREHR
jgi:flagellar hook-associated protein 1 FlgK